MKRFLWLGLLLSVLAIWTGCGDTFRPIIIPNPPAFPDPRATHSVISINNNGNANRGTALVVDVSGDTEVGVADLGLVPVHAVQQTANQVLVVNQATPGAVADSLTKVGVSGTSVGTPTTISLPPDSAPSFVATTQSDTAYVLLPGLVPPSVGVVSTGSNVLLATIPVGVNPVAMAETPNGKKLYVANKGDNTISAFNTIDRSPRTISNGVFNSPLWLVARSDSQRVYVLDGDGTLITIDTSATSNVDTVIAPGLPVGTSVNTMFYDVRASRLYIPSGNQLTVVDVSQDKPQILKTVSIPQIPSVPPVDAFAVAATALPDGSRAYVASVSTNPQPTQISISAVKGDGVAATYTYTLTGGHDPAAGITIAVSGITPAGFDGTFTVTGASGTSCDQPSQTCTFQVANTTVATQTSVAGSGASIVDNFFPQVTVITTAGNVIKTTVGTDGFPDATNPSSLYFVPVCAATRFRYSMAAAGDSSRIYLSSCDAGGVGVIRTFDDTFIVNLFAPASVRAPIPPSSQPPPQNPVFLFAGP